MQTTYTPLITLSKIYDSILKCKKRRVDIDGRCHDITANVKRPQEEKVRFAAEMANEEVRARETSIEQLLTTKHHSFDYSRKPNEINRLKAAQNLPHPTAVSTQPKGTKLLPRLRREYAPSDIQKKKNHVPNLIKELPYCGVSLDDRDAKSIMMMKTLLKENEQKRFDRGGKRKHDDRFFEKLHEDAHFLLSYRLFHILTEVCHGQFLVPCG